MTWDPELYQAFPAQREGPFFDLMERVDVDAPRRIIDAGCGPGTLTAWLARRYPDAHVVGVDLSREMLAVAPRGAPRLAFVRADISRWRPKRPANLVTSNATLHWLPDHDVLLPHLVEWLSPGGTLAVQVPANHEAPSHQACRDLTSDPTWGIDDLVAALPNPVLTIHDYERILAGTGCTVDAWEHTYEHTLAGAPALCEWLAGTTLRPVLSRLDPGTHKAFLARLLGHLQEAYGHGDTIQYPFLRRFFIARRRS